MITDQYLLNDVIYRMLENGAADANRTLKTAMFSISDIMDSMNRIQQQFLLETGIVVKRAAIAGIVGTGSYPLPTDSIHSRRLTWKDSTGTISTLTQCDTWELDHDSPNWPSDTGKPFAWEENTQPTQQVVIAPTPDDVGEIGLLYVQLAATLLTAGTVNLTVPDDWAPYIVWGTLAELLSSDGQAMDPVRAQYCDTRFQEGIELAKLILGG